MCFGGCERHAMLKAWLVGDERHGWQVRGGCVPHVFMEASQWRTPMHLYAVPSTLVSVYTHYALSSPCTDFGLPFTLYLLPSTLYPLSYPYRRSEKQSCRS